MGRGRVLTPRSAAAAGPGGARPEEPTPAVTTAPLATQAGIAFGAKGQDAASASRLRSEADIRRIEAALEPIRERALACTKCPLAETRQTVVFGCGTARSGIVFVGEAPGADEDEQGVPFVGRAGKLLDRILKAIEIPRDDVYICNILKCRPPGNRDPEPAEVAACSPYLIKQLAILEPRVICALGLHAAKLLLNTTGSMAKLRGAILRYRGIPTIATYHPAALLRNPNFKPAAWEDFQRLKRIADGIEG